MKSALYTGRVMHQRLRPVRHALRYRVFSLLIDLDEAAHIRLRWLSFNAFNLLSVRWADHGTGDPQGPRAFIDAQLRAAGLPVGGRITLLTMPRVLGYAFNPLNVYFCYAPDASLHTIVYEVNNTFGERHHYVIPGKTTSRGSVEQHCDKRFHVSPFMPMALDYRFRIEPPNDAEESALSIGIDVLEHGQTLLVARYDAQRHALSDSALLRAWLSHPLLTLKVIVAIHWQALQLWTKRVPWFSKPAATKPSISVGTSKSNP